MGRLKGQLTAAMPEPGKHSAMLRGATPDDAERLAWLRATSFGTRTAMADLEAPMADVLREHLRAGDFGAFLIEDGSVPVSTGSPWLPSDWNPSGRWGYVQSLETRPDHRGRGHAQRNPGGASGLVRPGGRALGRVALGRAALGRSSRASLSAARVQAGARRALAGPTRRPRVTCSGPAAP